MLVKSFAIGSCVSCFCLLHGLLCMAGNYIDLSFDGAVFCQPVVTLEQHGILSHTYNVEHTTEFRFP